MKVFSLCYQKKVCGFRFLFEKLGLVYDINKSQFKAYFEDVDKSMFSRLVNGKNLELIYSQDTDSFVTEEELNRKYKVISGEFNDCIPSWLCVLLHFDANFDGGNKYKYCPKGYRQFDYDSVVTVGDIDIANGQVIVETDNNIEYLVGLRDLRRF